MVKKRRQSQPPVIHHTSALTVDKDQALALRAAKKILQSAFTPTTTNRVPAPRPLPPSPIKRPKRRN